VCCGIGCDVGSHCGLAFMMEHWRCLKEPEFSLEACECVALERLAARALALRPCHEPTHYMIAGHGVSDELRANPNEPEHGEDVELTVARDLAARLAKHTAPGHEVISIRLLLSPPGAPAQQWHLDYARHFTEVQTAFVAVSQSTADNCTELLDLGDQCEHIAKLARSTSGPLPESTWRKLCPDAKVRPLEFAQWDVCALRTSHVFHRRGPNKSDFTRITFNVDLACLTESPGFIDVDMQRSLAEDRLCGQEYVDDLEEQDVTLEGELSDDDRRASLREPIKQVLGGG